MKRLVHVLAVLVCLGAFGSAAVAQDVEPPKLENAEALFKTWEQQAAAADESLEGEWTGDKEDEARRVALEKQRADARVLADKAKAAAVPLEEQLEALGSTPEDAEKEDAPLAAERAELQKKIDALKATAGKAELAFTRADRLLGRIADARRERFTARLLTRGPTPLDPANWATAGESLLSTGTKVTTETVGETQRAARSEVWRESGPIALAALLFSLVLMVVARRAVLRWLYTILGDRKPIAPDTPDPTEGTDISTLAPQQDEHNKARSRATRLFVGVGVTLTRLAIPLVALLAARFALVKLQIFGETGEIVLDGIAVGAGIIATAYAIVYAFFAPFEPRLRLSLADDDAAKTSARYSMLIALTMALNYALVHVGEALGWPLAALAVINALIIAGGSIALWRLARVSARVDEQALISVDDEETPVEDSEMWLSMSASRIVRRIAYAVAIAAPLLAIGGYFALSRFVFYNTLLSGAVFAAGILLFSVAKEGTSALSEATRDRKGGDQPDTEADKEGGLLPVFVGFLLILAALPILALIWGATRGDLGEVYFALGNGFKVGDSTFRPGDLLIAAFVFGVGLFLTRIVQAIIRRTVMPRTRLDMGARSSIVSGLGYLGFFIAVLVAISAGGLDLTNLAFLGAALGVGIGFGLQNIVNNFVSGIILLIERPIKIGDWIEVAGTHGVVEKVNVRSTEIKTFDKASYIVPNSELISGAVTNMTHGDLMGRVIAPVGVAYGTDTRKVEKILLEILRAHPMVLRRPAPQVIFKGFGADSLDFEARGFLRDVNWILSTHSDINFEIDRRFREEKIEIPFAQRDLHIKNAGPLVDALKAKAEADAEAGTEAGKKPAKRRAQTKPAEGTMGDGDGDY